MTASVRSAWFNQNTNQNAALNLEQYGFDHMIQCTYHCLYTDLAQGVVKSAVAVWGDSFQHEPPETASEPNESSPLIVCACTHNHVSEGNLQRLARHNKLVPGFQVYDEQEPRDHKI